MKNWAGKRRSKAQLTGETGEDIFKTWASKHRLSATKPTNDYGIDFWCHVFLGSPDGAQRLSGAVLATQVRSTTVKAGKQRVKLDRDDAHAALKADVPYLLVGVDVAKNRVYFRFLEETLMTKLQALLSGHKKSLSWPLAQMEMADDVFYRQLDEFCQPRRQYRLRWSRAKLDVAAMAPGSTVSFLQIDDHAIARVKMPLITSAFDVPATVQQEAAEMVFARGEIPSDAERFPPHPAISALGELVNGSVVLEGPIERTTSLTVQAPGRTPVTISVAFRSIGDEMGFVLQCGLYLTFSATRRKGDQLVHEFDDGIAVGEVKRLSEVPDEVEFLKCLCAGATIGRGDGPKFPVDHWGRLQLLGPDLQRITKIMAHYALPMDGLRLTDVVTEHFQISAHVATAFTSGEGQSVLPSFVFEEPLDGKPPPDAGWLPCTFKVPVVMNLGKTGLTIWSSGIGSVYISDDGELCGFRAERQDAWNFEKRDEPFSNIDGPELWFSENWPGIPLATVGTHSVTYRGTRHPFAATISMLKADDLPTGE